MAPSPRSLAARLAKKRRKSRKLAVLCCLFRLASIGQRWNESLPQRLAVYNGSLAA